MSDKLIELNEAIKEANNELDKLKISPFSEKAYITLKDKISEFIGQLITESIKISKREHSDLISQTQVEQATANLISKRKSKSNYIIGTLGGILLGSTISNIFGMLILNQVFSTVGIILTLLTGIIGTFMVTINVKNE